MYEFLKHAHSGLRWVVLFGLLFAIIQAYLNRKGEWQDKYRKIGLIAFISSHTQLLLGLILYAITPRIQWAEGMGAVMKNSNMRFWAVEHISIMILGIVFITVGYIKAKRPKPAPAIQGEELMGEHDKKVAQINALHIQGRAQFRAIYVFYSIGLLLILLGIPWPFGKYGVGWF